MAPSAPRRAAKAAPKCPPQTPPRSYSSIFGVFALLAAASAVRWVGCGYSITNSAIGDAGSQAFPSVGLARAVESAGLSEDGGLGTLRAETLSVAALEEELRPTYEALPKDSAGLLGPRAARYAMQRYLERKHGWLVQGLEPHGMRRSSSKALHEVSIIRASAPTIMRELVSARRSGNGMTLRELALLSKALERMIVEDSTQLLQTAFRAFPISASQDPDAVKVLEQIVIAWLYLYSQGDEAPKNSAALGKRLQQVVQAAQNDTVGADDSFKDIALFSRDSIKNYDFERRHISNPFKAASQASPSEASGIVEHILQHHGKWQNHECVRMRDALHSMDTSGTGRVPLKTFHRKGKDTSKGFGFMESAGYLRETGALDESMPNNPKVLIVNYLIGPSNCLGGGKYHSICCMSECEDIMLEIEGRVRAPMAPPEELLVATQNLTSTPLSPKSGSGPLWAALQEKMYAIAAQHGGSVPLHGRLFSQWLHAAFPRQCPFPAVVENAASLSHNRWKTAASITKKDSKPKMGSTKKQDGPSTRGALLSFWSDQEVLPVEEHENPSEDQGSRCSWMRIVASTLAVVFTLRSLWGTARSTISAAVTHVGDVKSEAVSSRRGLFRFLFGRLLAGPAVPADVEEEEYLAGAIAALPSQELTRLLRRALGAAASSAQAAKLLLPGVPRKRLEARLKGELRKSGLSLAKLRAEAPGAGAKALKGPPSQEHLRASLGTSSFSDPTIEQLGQDNSTGVSAGTTRAGDVPSDGEQSVVIPNKDSPCRLAELPQVDAQPADRQFRGHRNQPQSLGCPSVALPTLGQKVAPEVSPPFLEMQGAFTRLPFYPPPGLPPPPVPVREPSFFGEF